MEHPTYAVQEVLSSTAHKVSVRRLRKVPVNPFVAGQAADDEDPDSGEEEDGGSLVLDHQQINLADFDQKTFFLYSDGGKVYAGKYESSDGEQISFQDVVLCQRKNSVKLLRTWVDESGVLVYANYQPKNSQSVIYKLRKDTILKKIHPNKNTVASEEFPKFTVFAKERR